MEQDFRQVKGMKGRPPAGPFSREKETSDDRYHPVTQEEAKRLILRAWYALPERDRKTEHQAAVFAMKVKDTYSFKSSADKYQLIVGWLRTALAGE